MGHEIERLMAAAVRLGARGAVGVISVALAVLACYGLLGLSALLPLIGIRFVLDEAVWAGTIVGFALLTLLAVLPGFRHHRSVLPGLAALVGAGLIAHALLVDYRALIEFSGFVCLVGAVCVDVRLRRSARGRSIGSVAGHRERGIGAR